MIWYVAAGSAVGGVARYLLGTMVQQRLSPGFPVGTLLINVSGSLLVGFLYRWAVGSVAITPESRALLMTGFCGGYTTFSTFALDWMLLAEDGQYGRSALYVASSVLLSLLAVWLGFILARELLVARAHH
jgi:fluoride exporter